MKIKKRKEKKVSLQNTAHLLRANFCMHILEVMVPSASHMATQGYGHIPPLSKDKLPSTPYPICSQ